MTFTVKQFDDLTPTELYEIVKTRFEIFVLEQKIMCRDLDDVDKVALHVFCREGGSEDGRIDAGSGGSGAKADPGGRVTGYLRLFWQDEAAGIAKMGRVVTLTHGRGIGGELLRKGIEVARRQMHARTITLHSQQYCIGYYEREGFVVTSDVFLEEGIPHVEMELRLD